jgi:hypothetical protein
MVVLPARPMMGEAEGEQGEQRAGRLEVFVSISTISIKAQ